MYYKAGRVLRIETTINNPRRSSCAAHYPCGPPPHAMGAVAVRCHRPPPARLSVARRERGISTRSPSSTTLPSRSPVRSRQSPRVAGRSPPLLPPSYRARRRGDEAPYSRLSTPYLLSHRLLRALASLEAPRSPGRISRQLRLIARCPRRRSPHPSLSRHRAGISSPPRFAFDTRITLMAAENMPALQHLRTRQNDL